MSVRHAEGWAPMGDRLLCRLLTGQDVKTKGGIVLAGKDAHARERLEAWNLEVLAVSLEAERAGYAAGQVVRALRHACVELEETAKLYTVQVIDVVAVQAQEVVA